jgi:hypothetical protein
MIANSHIGANAANLSFAAMLAGKRLHGQQPSMSLEPKLLLGRTRMWADPPS